MLRCVVGGACLSGNEVSMCCVQLCRFVCVQTHWWVVGVGVAVLWVGQYCGWGSVGV